KIHAEDKDFEYFSFPLYKDPYYLKWGHTYQTGIHCINCNPEDKIPQEYKDKSIKYSHIKVQLVPLGINEMRKYILDHNYEVLEDRIQLYFKYNDMLEIDANPDKIIRSFTEHQLES